MTQKRRGLGKGLGALIPTTPDQQSPEETKPVDVFFGDPGEKLPRTEIVGGKVTTTRAATVSRETFNPQPKEREGTQRPAAKPRTGKTTRPASSTLKEALTTVSRPKAGSPTNGDDVEEELQPVPGAHFAELSISSITPNPRQPRTVFDEAELNELSQSIKAIGVLQPVVVRPMSTAKRGEEPSYELIMGERRLRASSLAGLDTIPAIIKDTPDDHLLRDALLENLHRSQLNPLEEAAAYQQLLEDFGCTHEDLASRIGRSRPQITNTIRLLRLPPLVARMVADGEITAGHARALLGLPTPDMMLGIADRIVREGLSVRAVEEIVARGGETPVRPKPTPQAVIPREQLDTYATALTQRLAAPVTVAMGARKGKVTVEFKSVDDLNRIMGLFTR